MDCNPQEETLDAALTLIHSREHASPKRLGDPGPNQQQLEIILSAAAAAPDHRQLTPWRLVIVPAERRHLLGEAFADALTERDGEASEAQRQEARSKAFRGPFLALVIARLDEALGRTHPQERLIAAGCAIQNMLLAAHAMGFGAGLSSGKSLYSRRLRELFRLQEDEQPLCFISVGTVTRRGGSTKTRPTMDQYTSSL